MALFKKKTEEKKDAVIKLEKKTEAKEVKATKESADVATVASTASGTKEGKALDLAYVLLRPHVTEKASDLSEKGVYAFEINKRANKMHVITPAALR